MLNYRNLVRIKKLQQDLGIKKLIKITFFDNNRFVSIYFGNFLKTLSIDFQSNFEILMRLYDTKIIFFQDKIEPT